MYSFATPPIKLKLEQQIGGGLLIANHQDQSLWWANDKHWVAVRSYLLHSFCAGAQRCCCAFYNPAATCAIVLFTSRGNMCNCAFYKLQQHVQLCFLQASATFAIVLSTSPSNLRNCAFYKPQQHVQLYFLQASATFAIVLSQNHFLEPNQHTLDFLHPTLLCRITYRAQLGMLLIQ